MKNGVLFHRLPQNFLMSVFLRNAFRVKIQDIRAWAGCGVIFPAYRLPVGTVCHLFIVLSKLIRHLKVFPQLVKGNYGLLILKKFRNNYNRK